MFSSTNAITPAGYDRFRKYLQKVCGISLSENKQYLVASRLGKLLEREGFNRIEALVDTLEVGRNKALKEEVINAMTTNETLWFRDSHPFNILREKILPEMKDRPLKIWSAASSTGQEPYSISMVIEEFKASKPGVLRAGERIVATDICTNILQHAKQAEYDSLAIARGLGADMQRKYFDKVNDSTWRVKRNLSTRVEFKFLNLIEPFSTLGKFDVIFCRNVLIYFTAETKLDILRRMHSCLNPGGYLFLGGSEALSGLSSHFDIVQCHPGIVYKAK
ncbi:CheR family methyltransferase [Marinomonas mediterranea]|jgi:MCP methyltransferase, CheR-type|uniref:protein-glutamate O-methyltransferase n=1 Tax=Marinomonas mediterranea (strain ATCC 700492 / JCM 21426 / NBRC 103028 / MMB-1) TaxID=717774 RepID=F2JT92_MARM1|nr:protein-glutamate O-methyltransferase CheR [Marinomonas mediterranea]ADZ90310.1 MCP methyltransferase, CheR-type [Marinomonas mediterranea MMB-1]WCN08370.1 methyltransferase domain-containing protein [Marinomonas mediterranea]WCN12426.1 methyltransferase domain-containing protein [Marinomonas mediterranea]WCN16499.1 methyltransferase domain-containing protein [Marinomonas mediterranea MMB-1]